jgi:hypothetical protein
MIHRLEATGKVPPGEYLLNKKQRLLLRNALDSLRAGDIYTNLCDAQCLHAVTLASGVGRILRVGNTTDYENPTS